MSLTKTRCQFPFRSHTMSCSHMIVIEHFPVVDTTTEITRERHVDSSMSQRVLTKKVSVWLISFSHYFDGSYHAVRSRTTVQTPSFGFSGQICERWTVVKSTYLYRATSSGVNRICLLQNHTRLYHYHPHRIQNPSIS